MAFLLLAGEDQQERHVYFNAHQALTEDDVREIWIAEGAARGIV